jgi:outer membrane lipoprotein-sorting protein
MNPYTFVNLYKKGYTITSTDVASGTQVHLVGKGKSISEMYILVDKSYNIKEIKFYQKGNWVTIHISNLKNQSLDDTVFTFNAKDFPKAEIIDLR